MATQTTSLKGGVQSSRRIQITRMDAIGLFLFLMGILMLVRMFDIGYDADLRTVLTLEPGAAEDVAKITVPSHSFLLVVSLLFVASGAFSLGRITGISDNFASEKQVKQAQLWLLILGGLLVIPGIMVAAAAGDRTNITTMFSESLRLATPLAIGAMAGLWCERAGVVNIAIEGMMLIAACAGFTTLFYLLRDFPDMPLNLALLLGVLVAILSGGVTALLHAWLSITFKTDQIVSGTVINILAVGLTSFIRREYLLSTEAGTVTLPNVEIPILADIPIIGQALFNNKPIFYLMFVIIIASHVVLFHTRWGLRTRAVGEHPHAADTLGINVNRMRWANVFLGGLIAGLAGAWFSLEATGRFTDNMTRGSGFIALASLIFGKWTPFGAFTGALLFGFSDALGVRLQALGGGLSALDVTVPVQFLQMVPYLVTIVVLAGLIGRSQAPKAVGKPYEKE